MYLFHRFSLAVLVLTVLSAAHSARAEFKSTDWPSSSQGQSSFPDRIYSYQAPEKSGGSGLTMTHVAIFQNSDPWGYTRNQDILAANGISYTIYGSSYMGSVDLFGFDKVIISSVQDSNFYSALVANKVWFENYVSNGGILDIHAATQGDQPILPGGFQIYHVLDNAVSIIDAEHPIVTTPHVITDAELDGWGYSTHCYISNIPADGHEILRQTNNNQPCAVDLLFGAGRIFVTTQTVEWHNSSYNYLENTILYDFTEPDDSLAVSPSTGVESSGREGGPFTPSEQVYTLTNGGESSLDWFICNNVSWLDVSETMGTLGPGESIAVTATINSSAYELTPGSYSDILEFWNLTTSVARFCKATLTVNAGLSEISIADSISPTDDLQMPFGDVVLGLTRTEQITISNASSEYSLCVDDIFLRGVPTATANTPKLTVQLPGVSGGSAGGDASYCPASLTTPDRPAATMVVKAGYRALTGDIKVLLLASGDNPSVLRAGLAGFPDIDVVDYFDCRYAAPTAADLAPYNVVVVMSNNWFSDSIATGNALADYVDGGGKVVETVATFANNGGWELGGRFVTQEGYEPFTHGSPEYFTHSLGNFDHEHPIMDGVTALTNEIPVAVALKTGAVWVANWDNGTPLIATQGENVVGINMFVFNGFYAGDVPLLFHNAVVWLVEGSAKSFSLPNLPELPVIIPPLGHIDVQVAFAPEKIKAYGAVVKIKSSNTEPGEIDVALSGVGIPDPLLVDAAEEMSYSGHEGGPFVPTEYTIQMTNQGGEAVPWAITVPDWISLSQYSGSLNPGAGLQVVVGPSELAATLPMGDYTGTIVITDQLTGLTQQRTANLHVYLSPKVWVDPEFLNITASRGGQYTAVLTLGNDGDGPLNFHLSSREIPVNAAAKTQVIECTDASSGQIAMEYAFPCPAMQMTGGNQYVNIPGLERYSRIGAPILPLRAVQLLIPPGRKVSQVRAIPLATTEIDCLNSLAVGQRPYPLSQSATVEKTQADPKIYGMETPWPNQYLTEWTCQTKRGYQYLVTGILPVQYIPAQGKLVVASRVRLEVDLVASSSPVSVHPTPALKRQIRTSVDNPKALLNYPLQGNPIKIASAVGKLSNGKLPEGGPYQFVVITPESLAGASGPWNFQALCAARTSEGMPATIVTTEYIYANYSGTRPDGGTDNQTRIRNFVMDAYQTWGTQYVLLGGDASLVPPRYFWVEPYPGGGADQMPVDMYYGCVDPAECTFDNDHDGNYGEPTDGVGGGDVDLMAEVYIGRAAVADATEVANVVRKTLQYNECNDEAFLSRIAMVGEYLGFGGVSDYATASMEQIRLGGTYDGYFTYGFENTPLDTMDFVTQGCLPENPDYCWPLYDSPTFDWSKWDLINLMNGGVHVFNHLGHANETYCMKMDTGNINSLVNDMGFFAYSQGCDSGAFDYPNCFAEVLTTSAHGAFSAILNARYGWGTYNSTDGPSQRFDRQFWDAALGEGLFEIGRMNQDSKEDNLYDINGGCIRWCTYELNLFGDPAQVMKVSVGCPWLDLDPIVGSVSPGSQMPINILIKATGLEIGTYQAEINVATNDPEVPLIVIPLNLTVREEPLHVLPEETVVIAGVRGGPFNPASGNYHLTNEDTSPIQWEATDTAGWFACEPANGTLNPGESVDVSYVVTPQANSLPNGVYQATVVFRNAVSQANIERQVTLTVSPPEYYTELFSANDNDLRYVTWVFTPDGSGNYYRICRFSNTAFPTNPVGGTVLTLADDDYKKVTLAGGAVVGLYGSTYHSFYVGSNGYITFDTGDTAYGENLAQHFKYKRISAMFDDLSPNVGGQVSWKQTEDRVAVTYKDVPELHKANRNNFQIELFYDGVIALTYLQVDALDGLVGLSNGTGIPADYTESNFMGYALCGLCDSYPPDGSVDVTDLAVLTDYWMHTDCGADNLRCALMDANGDGKVNLVDMSYLAGNWLEGN